MNYLLSVLSGIALLVPGPGHAHTAAAAPLSPAVASDAPLTLAQVDPSPSQRSMPGAGTASGAPQAGTGSVPSSTAIRPGMNNVPGSVPQGAAMQGGAVQGGAVQGGIVQGRPIQGTQGGAGQGTAGRQSSGNQPGGSQASGAPGMPPPSPADAAPQSAMPPAGTPAAPAAVQAPPSQAPAASGGSAVVVVPEGAKKIAPQVTLRGIHASSRDKQRTGKARSSDAARSAARRGAESSGANR